MIPRLKATYEKEIISKLMSKLNFKNKHEVPKIETVETEKDLILKVLLLLELSVTVIVQLE